MTPRASARQHEHDGGEHVAIVERAGAASLRARDELRNQRYDQVPQRVGHQALSEISRHDRNGWHCGRL